MDAGGSVSDGSPQSRLPQLPRLREPLPQRTLPRGMSNFSVTEKYKGGPVRRETADPRPGVSTSPSTVEVSGRPNYDVCQDPRLAYDARLASRMRC